MDKDLKKAVLAAFDADEPPTVSVPAPVPAEKSLADQDKGGDRDGKRSPSTKKELAAAARRSSGGTSRRQSASGTTKAAAAVTAEPASGSRGRETASSARGSRGNGALWLLNAVTLALLLVVLVQAYRLQTTVNRLSRDMANGMKDIRNYSRVHITTYAEAGKPPQQVTAVIEIKDGLPKIVATETQPLDRP